jgi:TatD DNase family protein
MYVDAHSHLDKYSDVELSGVLETTERHRILTLSVSVDGPSFIRAEGIAARSAWVVPSFGVHPEEATRYVDSLGDVREFAGRSPVFGEIGLDYRTVDDESLYPAQRDVFEWFLDLARTQDKMVSVHCVGAEQDTADLLARYDSVRAIVHWYSGPLDVLQQMIDTGHMFSVGVEVLHSEHIRQVAAAIPTDQLLTETDNPGGPRWLTGDTGYPHLIIDIVDVLADVRGESRDNLVASVHGNLTRLVEDDVHLAPWRRQLSS